MREPEIKSALATYLHNLPSTSEEALVVEEINVCEGAARIDVLFIDDCLHGFEIKSRVDTMARWPDQICYYQEVFERVTIVIGVNHLTKALQEIPTWCGLMLASKVGDKVSIEPFRDCTENPHRDRLSLAQLLWRDEAVATLERHGYAKGVKSKTRPIIWDRVANSLSLDDIGSEVRAALKARGETWRRDLRDGGRVVRKRRRRRRKRRR